MAFQIEKNRRPSMMVKAGLRSPCLFLWQLSEVLCCFSLLLHVTCIVCADILHEIVQISVERYAHSGISGTSIPV